MEKQRLDGFISYARADDSGEGEQSLVRMLYERLSQTKNQNGRQLQLWLDRINMPGRAPSFTEAIANAISRCDRLVLMIGEHMQASTYVKAEWQFAQRCGCQIYPVLYAHSSISNENFNAVPTLFSGQHVFDLRTPGSPIFADELARLIREFQTPLPEKSPLFGVPAYDDKNYVIREKSMLAIKKALFSATASDIDSGRFTAIFGMAGSGKSSLAAFLCHDALIRRSFPDGVVWLSITRNYQISRIWLQLASYFPHLPRDLSEDEIETRIRKHFLDKQCFFILDDVWSPQVLTMFHNALGDSKNHFLITSRERCIVQFHARNVIALEVMDKADALQLLSRYADCSVEEMGEDAAELASMLGYLPLALAIAGAMYRDGKGWGLVKQIYQAKKLEFLSKSIDHYAYEGHESAFVAIQMSVDSLQQKLSSHYKQLAVFPKSEDIPVSAVRVLWEQALTSPFEAEELLLDLAAKALLSYDRERQTVRLHDLQNDFLLLILGDIRGMHAAFLEAYRKYAPNGWFNGPNDGYFFNNLVYHLISVSEECEQEAFETLCDYRWIDRKLCYSGIEELREDYRIAKRAGAPTILSCIQEFLTISAHVLAEDPSQLPSQLYGRLLHVSSPDVQKLLQQAKEQTTHAWIRPVTTCMHPTDTGLLNTINTGEWIMSLANLPDHIVVCDWIGRIRAFCPETKECTSQYATGCKILTATQCGDILYACDENNVLHVFNTDRFEILHTTQLPGVPLCITSGVSGIYLLMQGGMLAHIDSNGNCECLYHILPDCNALAVIEEGVILGTQAGLLLFFDPITAEQTELEELGSTVKILAHFHNSIYAGTINGDVWALDTDSMFCSFCLRAAEPIHHITLWGDILVAGGYLGSLYFFDIKTNSACGSFDIGARIDALMVRKGLLITGNSAGKIQSFDQRLLDAHTRDAGIRSIKRCCAFKDALLLADRQGVIHTLDPLTLTEIAPAIKSGLDVRDMVVFDDRLYLADERKIYLLENGTLCPLFDTVTHEIRNFTIFEHMLCLCDKNGSVSTYLPDGTEQRRCEIESYITAIRTAFGQLLITDDFGMIRFFTKEGRLTKRLESDIWIRAIAAEKNEIITGDWFGKLRIWNRITGKCLQLYHADNAIDSLCKIHDRYFAVTKGGRLHVLEKENGSPKPQTSSVG